MNRLINTSEVLVFMLKIVDKDKDPFTLLAKMCRPVMMKAIKRRYIRGFDEEDFMQEANEVLLESISKYKLEEDMKFLQFYSMQLENHFNMLVRKENAFKRRSIKEATSYDRLTELENSPVHFISTHEIAPEDSPVLQESLDEYILDLSPFEKKVFFFYIGDMPYDEIAKVLKCDKDKVQNAMHRCSLKLRRLFQMG